jgi:hypothetical protein
MGLEVITMLNAPGRKLKNLLVSRVLTTRLRVVTMSDVSALVYEDLASANAPKSLTQGLVSAQCISTSMGPLAWYNHR